MFKKSLILFFLIIITTFLWQCTSVEKVSAPPHRTIVLVNPSSWSLNSFLYLVDHDIVRVDDVRWQVIYDSKSADRYRGGQRLLEKYPSLKIQLDMFDEDLSGEVIFQENNLTGNFRKIFEESEGMLFFGGGDIPPSSYGEKSSLLSGIDTPHRHYFELSLIFHLLGGYQNEKMVPFLQDRPDYVVFGFCLGMQTMNAATGGTLIQDIPSEVYGLNYIEDILLLDPDQLHQNYWNKLYADDGLSGNQFHKIRLLKNQFWVTGLKMDPTLQPVVYSYHHQAVEKIGKGFVVGATSLDGKIVESIHHNSFPNVLGVQFHPENYLLYRPDEKSYKFIPADTVLQSHYQILSENNSLDFHYAYWNHFNALFD